MALSLRPEHKKYILIPAMLGLSFFLDHYKGRIGRTLQADASSLEFLDPACRPTPVVDLHRTPQQRLHASLQKWHHAPSLQQLATLITKQGEIYTQQLPFPTLPATFASEVQSYKRTTQLARILDHCRATRDVLTPVFTQRSAVVERPHFPRYQRYVLMQYTYAQRHGGNVCISPTFFTTVDSIGQKKYIEDLIELFPIHDDKFIPEFISLEHDTLRSQEWLLEKDNVCQKISTHHLPHMHAQGMFEEAGISLCSSADGFDECGKHPHKKNTCLHGIQPIVLQGCTLLQQQVQQQYMLSQPPQLVIRGGTEVGHDGGAVRAAGQMHPKFEHKILLTGKRHAFGQGRLQGAYKLFALHGFGNAVDIGIYDATTARAVHAFLDTGSPLIYGYRYRQVGPDCFVIAQSHGDGAGLHHHVSFVDATDMQYILDDIHGVGRTIPPDPLDTLMHAGEASDEEYIHMSDTIRGGRIDSLVSPPDSLPADKEK